MSYLRAAAHLAMQKRVRICSVLMVADASRGHHFNPCIMSAMIQGQFLRVCRYDCYLGPIGWCLHRSV